MSKSKDLLLDIGITLVVLVIATVILGITNYRNNQQDLEVFYKQIDAGITVFDGNLADTVHIFSSADEVKTVFPEFNSRVNWQENIVLTYISYPQPSSGYSLRLLGGEQQGQVITMRYKVISPPSNRSYLTVMTQPALMIAVNRVNLVTGNPLIFRFQNVNSNQTTSLNVAPDAI